MSYKPTPGSQPLRQSQCVFPLFVVHPQTMRHKLPWQAPCGATYRGLSRSLLRRAGRSLPRRAAGSRLHAAEGSCIQTGHRLGTARSGFAGCGPLGRGLAEPSAGEHALHPAVPDPRGRGDLRGEAAGAVGVRLPGTGGSCHAGPGWPVAPGAKVQEEEQGESPGRCRRLP